MAKTFKDYLIEAQANNEVRLQVLAGDEEYKIAQKIYAYFISPHDFSKFSLFIAALDEMLLHFKTQEADAKQNKLEEPPEISEDDREKVPAA